MAYCKLHVFSKTKSSRNAKHQMSMPLMVSLITGHQGMYYSSVYLKQDSPWHQ